MTDTLSLLFKNCKDESGIIDKPRAEAFVQWATFSDCLLMGLEIPVDLPDGAPGAHIVHIILLDEKDGERQPILSLFAACECIYPIDKDARVESQLKHPEQHINVPASKLYVPGRGR